MTSPAAGERRRELFRNFELENGAWWRGGEGEVARRLASTSLT